MPTLLAPRRAPRLRTTLAVGLAAALTTTTAVACAEDDTPSPGATRLVFFDSCEQALNDLRAATAAAVTPYGLGYGGQGGPWVGRGPVPMPDAAGDDASSPPQAVPQPDTGPDHSGTNVHESGVDEPDLVKTDGRRIVTLSDGGLRVIDVATRRLVGAIDLARTDGTANGYPNADLLLAGDHALVLSSGWGYPEPRVVLDRPGPGDPFAPVPAGTSVTLVDLTTPRVLSRAHVDGVLVDARQVGATVRIVLRSAPDLRFPYLKQGTDAQRLAANRAVVHAAPIEAWAPSIRVTTGDDTRTYRVPCSAISRPATYTGTSMLTVLTFDADQPALGDGAPVSIVADGDTVYSNGTSLYVASNQAAWLAGPPVPDQVVPSQARTDIYRFDITGDRPRFVAGGSVPGSLLNQYSLSEWNGVLRVATTTEASGPGTTSQSGIYLLATDGQRLERVGAVEGLGKGERIYAVRFLGPVGYVVTFRQTDPLYTVDLRDPRAPVVRGELKIPGYSAYLHPLGDDRLIGIGQDATDTGATLGTQVSIFDVSDLSDPTQLAKYTLRGAYSEAEWDPHAFLYWPRTGLLVVPLQSRGGGPVVDPDGFAPVQPTSGALVLRVDGDRIVEVGFLSHPVHDGWGYPAPVRRSLVTVDPTGGTTLWTVSDGGVMATDAHTLTRLAWIPL